GPGSTGKVYTVKEILENAAKLDKSDEVVTLKGYIVKQHNSDTYHFKDSTGEIRVEIEKKNLPATPFNEKTELLITGEVDFDLLEGTEVEADKVELVKKTE
ncbi:MAG: NirD/YgiW/YdeI family stress tolerance protein, partial [Bacteroidota bacterium]|nr:NirD/YgiW/YdeI family stress tolerance protein [Bacteroidota bacterium]